MFIKLNEMDELREMMFGSKFIAAEQDFKKRIDALQAKYAYWLDKNDDIISGVAPVDLHNYFMIYNNRQEVIFKMIDNSRLPQEVIVDLENAFRDTYDSLSR